MSSIGFGYAGWAAFGNEGSYGVPPTGTNEVQTITPNSAPGSGHITVANFGITTGQIQYGDVVGTIQTVFDTAFGVGNSTISGSLATAITVTWTGIYGYKNVPALTLASNTLGGGSYASIVVATGTPGVQPTLVYKELIDEGIELKQSKMEKPVLGTTSVTHSVNSKSSTEGPIKFQMQFNDIERLLYNAFGQVTDATASGETIVYTHTFALTDALPAGMTWWIDRDSTDLGFQFQYPGCQIDKLTLTQEVENMMICQVDLVGNGLETMTYPIAKPTPHTFNQIDYLMVGVCTIGGVSIPAKMSEFVLGNGLSKDRYKLGSNTRIDLQRGNVRKVSGKLTLEFQSAAQVLLFEQYTEFTLVMSWTGANVAASAVPTPYKLAITMNNCSLSGKTPNVKDWNVIQQELDFWARASVGNRDEFSLVLTNDVASMT